ncbi:MAG: hypothetical protein KF745_12350 [Phycisphaeraceae bacterium]|nr:hypothetical protein [Phycisphaeraceae bacterium]
MIIGIEIAITLVALYMLVMGRPMSKATAASWKFRLLGGLLLTMWPAVFLSVIILAFVWALRHPGLTREQFEDQIRWPAAGLEFGVVVVYAILGAVFEKLLKRQVAPARATPAQERMPLA